MPPAAPAAKPPEQPGHHRAVREQVVQVPEHRNPAGPGHGGEGVGLQPVGMDQIRRGPAECRPQPPDEPDRRRGLAQRGPPKPEPGQGAGPAIVPQPGIPESGKAGRERHHGHDRPQPLGLGPERTVGEQHHFQSRAGKVFAGPANRREQDPLGPAHDPDRAQKGDSHGRRCELRIDIRDVSPQSLPGVSGQGRRSCTFSNRMALCVVVDEPVHGQGQGLGIARPDSQGIPAFGEEFGRAAGVRHDHRAAASHRLDDRPTERLRTCTGVDHHVECPERVGRFRLERHERQPIGHSQLACQLSKLLLRKL